MINFFNSEFIKKFYIDINFKRGSVERIGLEDFIEILDFLSNNIYIIFYHKLVKDITITLYLDKEIENEKVNEIMEKIREEKLSMDIKYFTFEITLDNFIEEEFLNNQIKIKLKNIESLDKEIIEDYFKRFKNVLED